MSIPIPDGGRYLENVKWKDETDRLLVGRLVQASTEKELDPLLDCVFEDLVANGVAHSSPRTSTMSNPVEKLVFGPIKFKYRFEMARTMALDKCSSKIEVPVMEEANRMFQYTRFQLMEEGFTWTSQS